MTRFILAVAIVVASASVASAQYPYNYGNGYAIPTVPQLPGTYMSGPGYVVGGGYGASVWSTPGFTIQSYNPYWGQQNVYRPQPYNYNYNYGNTYRSSNYRGYQRP